MTTYCAVNLMELLAIPLGCQRTATKWLVMRRCVLALTNLKESLRRNFVVTCSSPTNFGMSRHALRGALHLDLLVTVVEIR